MHHNHTQIRYPDHPKLAFLRGSHGLDIRELADTVLLEAVQAAASKADRKAASGRNPHAVSIGSSTARFSLSIRRMLCAAPSTSCAAAKRRC